MNKKIFAILLISVFLIAAASFVCAANEKITVSMNWKDAGFESERPSEVTVNLIEDGKIIDTIILKNSKLWTGVFKVSEYGDYSIEVEDIPNYEVTTKNTYEDEYNITAKIMKDSVLKASDDEPTETNDKDTSDDKPAKTNDKDTKVEKTDKKAVKSSKKDTKVENTNTIIQQVSSNKNILGNNGTNNNGTQNNTNNNTNNNTTNKTNDTAKNKTNTTTKVTTTETIRIITKEPKQNKTPEKDNNTNATDLKNTGIPIAGLILVVMAAILIPLFRRKD